MLLLVTGTGKVMQRELCVKNMKELSLFLLIASVFHSVFPYTKEALQDQVTSLPRALSAPASNQFSGYLQIDEWKFIHYYYFESEKDPNKDDIIFWTNGGPGCSGMLGLFTEMGPWRPIYNGSVERNPYTWTQEASMVFLEQPVGVGYSYTTDSSNLDHFGDFQASIDNLKTVKAFFEKFPERNSQGFYLASESYGGHYIPQWTLQLLSDSKSADLRNNFRGFLVGNPYTSYASGSIGFANVLWGLQLIPLPAWKLMQASTCDMLSHNPYFLDSYAPQCFAYMDALDKFATALNPYALEFPICSLGSGFVRYTGKLAFRKSQQAHKLTTAQRNAVEQLHPKSVEYEAHFQRMKALLGEGNRLTSQQQHAQYVHDPNVTVDLRSPSYDACTDMYTVAYLSSEDVRQALHVSPTASKQFAVCNDELNSHWSLTDVFADTTGLYSKIFNHPNKPKDFRMLVFSGDADGVCATIGTQHWIYSINGSKIVELFQPWMYEDSAQGQQVGGYLTTFSGRLSFATVHFAGHEVPAYQPQKALVLLQRYLNGSLFAPTEDSTNSGSDTSGSSEGAVSPSSNSLVPIVIGTLLVISVIIGWILCLLPKSVYSRDEQQVEIQFNRLETNPTSDTE